jgi:hypothetical protein
VAAAALERSAVFGEARNALLLFVALCGAAVVALLFRHARTRRRPATRWGRGSARRWRIVLPAIVPSMRRSALARGPVSAPAGLLAGVPFFALALADPHTGFAQEDVSYPGRRIALLVDASTSMVMSFGSES